jgi:2-desacetyl-2-hydroxyethyl bacteriochlorophyllide A dehydrogenase
MKAMVLRSPGKMALEEVDAPQPGGGNTVLIRVTHTGVCGTDLEIFRGKIPVRHPLIMGHEIAGTVADPGRESDLRTGDRVVIDPMVSCGTCFHCRVGQTNLCPNGTLLGRDANGGFAGYLAVPGRNVFRLPDSIPNSIAPLIQVTATCVHSQHLAPIFPGESVAVLGLGVTGQIQAQLAKARGAGPVIGISRGSFKRDMAKQLGTDIPLESGEGAIDKVLEETKGRGADMVIESTGRIDLLADAIKMTRIGGRLLLFGIYTAQEARLPFYDLYVKELSLFCARAARSEDFDTSVALVERGALNLTPLVTHVLPLVEIQRAIEMNGTPMDRRLKVIVDHES